MKGSFSIATSEDVKAVLADPSSVPPMIDVRMADGEEYDVALNGSLSFITSALSAPIINGVMPTSCVKDHLKSAAKEKGAPVVLFCKAGVRASNAAALLAEKGLLPDAANVVCTTASEIARAAPRLAHKHHFFRDQNGMPIFKMLFDDESSTMTYILGCPQTREAVIIDPVLEHSDRDIQAAADMNLHLKYAINTHCHADHITGTGVLKTKLPSIQSAISAASGAQADIKLAPFDTITFGERALQVLPTPGHTEGCVCFYDDQMGAVFTGDALMIGGCGRTDFQGGDAKTLHASVHAHVFTLPDETLVFPAHDYKGRRVSTVEHEKKTNPRLSKGVDEFVDIMASLNLKYPSKIDVALPKIWCADFKICIYCRIF